MPANEQAPPPAPDAPICTSRFEGDGGRCIYDAGHGGDHLHVDVFAREFRWESPPAPDARGVACDADVQTLRDAAALLRAVDGLANATPADEWSGVEFGGALTLSEELDEMARALAARAAGVGEAEEVTARLDDVMRPLIARWGLDEEWPGWSLTRRVEFLLGYTHRHREDALATPPAPRAGAHHSSQAEPLAVPGAVLCSVRDPDTVAHRASARCSEEAPHPMQRCGEFDPPRAGAVEHEWPCEHADGGAEACEETSCPVSHARAGADPTVVSRAAWDAIQAEQARPADDTPERRAMFARVDAMAARAGADAEAPRQCAGCHQPITTPPGPDGWWRWDRDCPTCAPAGEVG